MWLLAVWACVIGSTPWIGDDIANRFIRVVMPTPGLLWGTIVKETRSWMDLQGRFFPGSVAWTRTLLWLVNTRVAYKLVLVALMAFAVLAVALLARRITRSAGVAAVTVVLFGSLLTLRILVDPVAGFTGLITLTTGLTVAATWLLIVAKRWWWGIVAALAYAAALVTYETVILFAPVMIAVVLFERRRWPWTLPVIIPAALQTIIVLVLRSRLTTTSAPAYTLNLDPGAVASTLVRQMTAALPGTQWLGHARAIPPFTKANVAVALVVVAVPVFLAIYHFVVRRHDVSWARIGMVGGFGAWMWFAPSVQVAITTRWQTELYPGEGYLPVGYAYFGVALLCAAALLALDRLLVARGDSTGARRATAVAAGVVVAISAVVSLAGSLGVAATYAPNF